MTSDPGGGPLLRRDFTILIIKYKLIAEWLTELKKKKVNISIPKRSKKAEIIKLVEKNAQFELDLLEKEWIEIEESSIEND